MALTLVCAVLLTIAACGHGLVLPPNSLKTVGSSVQYCHDGLHLFVKAGHTWTDRCMTCRCDHTLGLVCDEPQCTIPYKPYHENSCVRWSEDGCCCEEFGCKVDGHVYQLNQSFPFPPGDPCGQCLCEMDTDHLTCTKKVCPIPVCVDAYQRPNECCMRCPAGPNCGIPYIEGVTAFNNRDLYTPLRLGRTRQLSSDINPLQLHECKCLVPGTTATCQAKAFSWLGG